MAKASYKQGAMSATDAVHQLQAASGKCDFKWMKAHAASARFFGAREAEVKKALSKCPSKRSGMMGLGGRAEDLLTDLEERALWSTKEDRRLLRSLRADDEEFRAAGVDPAQRADHIAKRAKEAMQRAYEDVGELRDVEPEDAAHAARTYTRLHKHGVRLSTQHDADMKRWKRELVAAGVAPEDLKGLGATPRRKKRGLKGTTAQHAARAAELAESIHRTVALAAKETPGMRKTLLRLATQAYEMGQAECSWVRADATVAERDSCRKLREAGHALWDTTKSGRARSNRRMREKARRTRYDEPSGVGAARGGCVFVVEKGRKRKVTSDLASAKSAGKRMAKKGSAKITKACSRGRGSDSGTVVARCTSRGCA